MAHEALQNELDKLSEEYLNGAFIGRANSQCGQGSDR